MLEKVQPPELAQFVVLFEKLRTVRNDLGKMAKERIFFAVIY